MPVQRWLRSTFTHSQQWHRMPSKVRCNSSDSKQAAHFSALQQELEFCCLVCGWETPCTACPFDWYGFDPRKHQRHRRKRDGLGAISEDELQEAAKLLGLVSKSSAITAQSFSKAQIKTAFRKMALTSHPDCCDDDDAEEKFKAIVNAYELWIATVPDDR